MLTAAMVKAHALHSGADLVGIASMDRFSELPAQVNPQSIFPEARAMIVLGFRLFRGIFRGVQEQTFYTAYNLMGYAGTKWVFQPITLWGFVKQLEDAGYEAVPIPDNFPWSQIDDLEPGEQGQGFIDVNPSQYGRRTGTWSRPVAPGRAAPDVFFQLRLAAYAAGLGEIGYSGMVLTPEFGPRQMFAAVLTDAELTPDPLYEGHLCDRCMACVNECPGAAISATETTRLRIAGREIEVGRLDFDRCAVAFHGGGERADNPWMVTEKDREGFNQQPYTVSKNYKIGPVLHGTGRGLGGMRGCQMACMAHLEEQGKLKNVFKRPFRSTGGAAPA
ncbi:MAG: epoxyqueuosine reductase [Lentisphaerae bacterium]|nr:epoxyqueuosine reductase [Lentisphaerota bacterium]